MTNRQNEPDDNPRSVSTLEQWKRRAYVAEEQADELALALGRVNVKLAAKATEARSWRSSFHTLRNELGDRLDHIEELLEPEATA